MPQFESLFTVPNFFPLKLSLCSFVKISDKVHGLLLVYSILKIIVQLLMLFEYFESWCNNFEQNSNCQVVFFTLGSQMSRLKAIDERRDLCFSLSVLEFKNGLFLAR